MSHRTGVVLLGSTGSIGKSTLDVIARHGDSYRVVALTANTDVAAMEQQCIQWRPAYAAMSDATAAGALSDRLASRGVATRVLAGMEGLCELAMLEEADTVVAGIVGAAGLLPTLSAARAGKRILLANKEALVMSGALFLREVRDHGAVLLPVDSEHNAIFQCLPEPHQREREKSVEQRGVNRILLTASGGPFRTRPLDDFMSITPAQAISHPNWVMGRKISIDSATMMNKGLEVIEARWLFDVELETIEVVIHPQSIIHSLVSYTDGSVLAQMGNPDMRTPIAHALAWPERIDSGVEPLDLFEVAKLEFEKPDLLRFPCLRLAYEAMRAGGSASIVLNAANEIAVAAFLEDRIRFTAIAELIEVILEKQPVVEANTLEEILEIDREARSLAQEHLQRSMTA